MATRREVLDRILKGELCDGDGHDGRRGDRDQNLDLYLGPEFGATPSESIRYLPAFDRYRGRFFVRAAQGTKSDSERLTLWRRSWDEQRLTLVLSGLYGFVRPEDQIQDYDCHLGDVWREGAEYRTLVDHWRPVLTTLLLELIERRGVQLVVDLLSERLYQTAIDWHQVQKAGVRTFHRCFAKLGWDRALPNMGRFFRHEILDKNPATCRWEHDRFETFDYFDPPDERVMFESLPGASRMKVRREGNERVRQRLEHQLASVWRRLDEVSQESLLNAAVALHESTSTRKNYQGLAVELTTAVELLLRSDVLNPIESSLQEADVEARARLEQRKARGKENPERMAPQLMLGDRIGWLEELAVVARRLPSRFEVMRDRWPGLSPHDVGPALEALARGLRNYNALVGGGRRHEHLRDRAVFKKAFEEAILILQRWPFSADDEDD